MTVYVLSRGYDQEGLYRPSGVFSTIEKAVDHMNKIDPLEDGEVWVQDLDGDFRHRDSSQYWCISKREVD